MSELRLSVPSESVGERMRRARRASGATIGQVAEDLGVHRNMVSRWENDRDQPRRLVLLAWSMRCGVPVEWLETGEVDGLPTGRYEGWCVAAA